MSFSYSEVHFDFVSKNNSKFNIDTAYTYHKMEVSNSQQAPYHKIDNNALTPIPKDSSTSTVVVLHSYPQKRIQKNKAPHSFQKQKKRLQNHHHPTPHPITYPLTNPPSHPAPPQPPPLRLLTRRPLRPVRRNTLPITKRRMHKIKRQIPIPRIITPLINQMHRRTPTRPTPMLEHRIRKSSNLPQRKRRIGSQIIRKRADAAGVEGRG